MIPGMSVITRLRRTYVEPLPMKDFDGYDGYWTARGGDPCIHPRWKTAVAQIPDGSTVLDVGCGSGGFMTYLTSQRPNVKVRGTDISPEAVAAARAAGFDAFTADLTVEPLDRPYDFITAFEVIEHIHEAERALVTMREAAREKLILSLPNIGYIEHRIRLAVFGRFPNTSLVFHAKEHIRHWTVKDFTAWVEHFGLRVVSVSGQYGSRVMPWRRLPGLFAPQVVYVLEGASAADD